MSRYDLLELRTLACDLHGTEPNLGDDACIYAGSATVEDWTNWVPAILVQKWPLLSEESRLCVFIGAKQQAESVR